MTTSYCGICSESPAPALPKSLCKRGRAALVTAHGLSVMTTAYFYFTQRGTCPHPASVAGGQPATAVLSSLASLIRACFCIERESTCSGSAKVAGAQRPAAALCALEVCALQRNAPVRRVCVPAAPLPRLLCFNRSRARAPVQSVGIPAGALPQLVRLACRRPQRLATAWRLLRRAPVRCVRVPAGAISCCLVRLACSSPCGAAWLAAAWRCQRVNTPYASASPAFSRPCLRLPSPSPRRLHHA